MINYVKCLNNNIKDGIEVAKITNEHFDKSSEHVNKANNKMVIKKTK